MRILHKSHYRKSEYNFEKRLITGLTMKLPRITGEEWQKSGEQKDLQYTLR